RGRPPAVRHLTAGVAVALLATSPENVDRLLVPMADAPAQLFTVLALLLALRMMRAVGEGQARPEGAGWLPPRSVVVTAALGGACFAWAYWVRHTQLVLIVPALAAVALGMRGGGHAAPAARPADDGRGEEAAGPGMP